MRKLTRQPLILPLLLIVSSCATIDVDVDYDDTVKFVHLSKYAWLEEDKIPDTGNTLVDTNTLLHDRIRNGIDQWFESHGYLKTKAAEADFLVIYQVVMENKTKVTVLNPYYDYPYSWNYGYNRYHYGYPYRWHLGYSHHHYSSFGWSYYPESYAYEYQRSTLVVDIIDPKSKKLMWRGMAYDDMSSNTSQEKKQQSVARTIQSILARFPPVKE